MFLNTQDHPRWICKVVVVPWIVLTVGKPDSGAALTGVADLRAVTEVAKTNSF